MKPTYQAYGKLTLGLKASIIPSTLNLVDSWVAALCTNTDYLSDVSLLSKAFAVFLLEVLFLAAIRGINVLEVKGAIKRLDKQIGSLEGCFTGTDRKFDKEVSAEIAKLQRDKKALYSK